MTLIRPLFPSLVFTQLCTLAVYSLYSCSGHGIYLRLMARFPLTLFTAPWEPRHCMHSVRTPSLGCRASKQALEMKKKEGNSGREGSAIDSNSDSHYYGAAAKQEKKAQQGRHLSLSPRAPAFCPTLPQSSERSRSVSPS